MYRRLKKPIIVCNCLYLNKRFPTIIQAMVYLIYVVTIFNYNQYELKNIPIRYKL